MYTIKSGYEWLKGSVPLFRHAGIVWNKMTIPRHSFTMWLTLQNKLLGIGCVGSCLILRVDLCYVVKEWNPVHTCFLVVSGVRNY